MTVTAASFRTDFPEFTSTTNYPDARVNFWLTLAGLMIDACRWKSLADHGTDLFIAHHLTLDRRNAMAVAAGGVPGASSGPMSAKSVDKVSASYDTAAVNTADAGHWNLSGYGQLYIQMVNIIGSGGLQL